MQSEKVITQVDEKHETDFPPPQSKQVIKASDFRSIQFNTDRLIHSLNNHQNTMKQTNASYSKQKEHIPYKIEQTNLIGKYNYYGKYRFQQKQKQLQIQKPQVNQLYKTENEFRLNDSFYSAKTENNNKKQKKQISVIAQDSMCLQDNEYHYPSSNYFIYFDKNNKKKNFIKDKQMDPNIQPTNTNWFLQKKVKALEKQVKELKQAKNHEFTQSRNSIFRKKDQPIKLGTHVQRMLETLWP